MNYGNPVQIGDKVSVAAMGTQGDKRGWEVLPPPNTQHRFKLVASKAGNTLLSSIVLMFILFRLKCFIQPKYFQKKTDFRTQMARWFSDILVPKHLLPHKRIKNVVRKKRDYVGKIPKWRTPSPHPPVWEFSHFFTVF